MQLRTLPMLLLTLIASVLALVACAGEQTSLPVPVGAKDGLNTLLYIYSDN